MMNVVMPVLGGLFAVAGLCSAIELSHVRIESLEELTYLMKRDVALGFMFAFAFLLYRLPNPPVPTGKRHYLTAAGVVFIWVSVSGLFLFAHCEQVRVRSTLPINHSD